MVMDDIVTVTKAFVMRLLLSDGGCMAVGPFRGVRMHRG